MRRHVDGSRFDRIVEGHLRLDFRGDACLGDRFLHLLGRRSRFFAERGRTFARPLGVERPRRRDRSRLSCAGVAPSPVAEQEEAGGHDDNHREHDAKQEPHGDTPTARASKVMPASYFLKMLFGIFTCTPSVWSTSWVIATSPATLVS